MAVTVYTKDEMRLLLGEQATWGTVLADGANYNGTTPVWGEILDVETVGLDFDYRVRLPDRTSITGRTLARENIQHDTKGCNPKITLTGDAKVQTLAALLYAVFQNVSEAVGSPYEKTYTFGTTQPDFTAGAGWFGTVVVNNPTGALDQKIKDVICNKLTLTWEPQNGQGRCQMVAELMGRGTPVMSSTISGTLAKYSQDFFYFHDLKSILVNGAAFEPTRIQLEINNNATPYSVDVATGAFLTYVLGSPHYECKLMLRGLWDTNNAVIQSNMLTDGTHASSLTWGVDNVYGYFNVAFSGQPGPATDVYDDAKEIDITYTGLGATPITIILADSIDRGW